ncbi:MAG TPA: sigma 54-interacting transcriptional regulator [Polyangiaceae bacterium]
MRVFVQSPEVSPLRVELAVGGALLLGREPSSARLHAGQINSLEVQRLRDRRVSANHVLLSREPDALVVRDLGSRNGSWLRLPQNTAVRIASDGTLLLELAGTLSEAGAEPGPRPATWDSEGDFAPQVCAAVAAYFDVLGLPNRVSLAPSAKSDPLGADEVLRFPLEDGSSLAIQRPADLTADARVPAALERVRTYVALANASLRSVHHDGDGLILSSPRIREAHRQVEDAAQKRLRLVLLGPSGAGKDRLARCYHEHSRQTRGPFHAVNCGQLSKELMYAQLFGAAKGSFTGATRDVVGAVEAAAEGTLFLDEVAEMPKDVQVALLRFLDRRGEYHRLGEEHRPRTAHNVQIVCATNDDVLGKLARGELREDFWYRIAECTVTVAPLSERPEDVALYLEESVPGERREDTLQRLPATQAVSTYDALSPPALARVLAEKWPGNFRSLENFVVRLPLHADRGSIDLATCARALDDGLGVQNRPRPPELTLSQQGDEDVFKRSLERALAAFDADQHGTRGWGTLVHFVESYLKPAFVAHACGLDAARELPGGTNLSELARRLDLKDGTTVRTHLTRYFGTFSAQPSLVGNGAGR